MSCYIDHQRRELVGCRGRKQLTPLEYKVMDRLLQADGETVTKDELIESAYDEEVLFDGVTDQSLAQIISRLRRKMNVSTPLGSTFLKCVYGVGYILHTDSHLLVEG